MVVEVERLAVRRAVEPGWRLRERSEALAVGPDRRQGHQQHRLVDQPGAAQARQDAREITADRLQGREREQLGHEGYIDAVGKVVGRAVAELRQDPPGHRARHPVRQEAVRLLKGDQRRFGGAAEAAVDPARRKARHAQSLLQELDISPMGTTAKNAYHHFQPTFFCFSSYNILAF